MFLAGRRTLFDAKIHSTIIPINAPTWVTNPNFSEAAMYADFTQPVGDGTFGLVWFPKTGTITPARNVFTRQASGGAAIDAAGNVVPFSGTVLRTTSAGLVTEPSVTNEVRNSISTGATAGSPGSGPTYWIIDQSVSGLTRSIIGTGTTNGIPYVDIRYYGTTTTAAAPGIHFDQNNQIQAEQGITFTASTFVSMSGGSTNGITTALLGFDEYDGSGNLLSQGSSSFQPSATFSRYSYTRTVVSSNTSYVQPSVYIQCMAGAAIDITLRFGLPQVEQNSFVTTPIFTSGAAVTRAQDGISATNPTWLGTSGSGSIMQSIAFSGNTGAPMLSFVLDDGSFANAAYLNLTSAPNLGMGIRLESQTEITLGTGIVALGSMIKMALAFGTNDAGFATRTVTASRVTSGITAPPISQVHVGSAYDGSQCMAGTIGTMAYFSFSLPNTTLSAICG